MLLAERILRPAGSFALSYHQVASRVVPKCLPRDATCFAKLRVRQLPSIHQLIDFRTGHAQEARRSWYSLEPIPDQVQASLFILFVHGFCLQSNFFSCPTSTTSYNLLSSTKYTIFILVSAS